MDEPLVGFTVQTSDPHMSDSTNLRHTNVGQYKRRTCIKNVGLVQTFDQYKCQTSTNVLLVHTSDSKTSDQYKCRNMEKKENCLNFKIF